MFIYYVYAYVRESNHIPYYIGKGHGKRAFAKHKGISVPKDRSKIVFIERNLSEVGAYAIERRLIRWYGRKFEGGVLLNTCEGGEGNSSPRKNARPFLEAVCDECNGKFISKNPKKRFCSRQCANRKNNSLKPAQTYVEHTCLFCSESFKVPSWKRPKYCSKRCTARAIAPLRPKLKTHTPETKAKLREKHWSRNGGVHWRTKLHLASGAPSS